MDRQGQRGNDLIAWGRNAGKCFSWDLTCPGLSSMHVYTIFICLYFLHVYAILLVIQARAFKIPGFNSVLMDSVQAPGFCFCWVADGTSARCHQISHDTGSVEISRELPPFLPGFPVTLRSCPGRRSCERSERTRFGVRATMLTSALHHQAGCGMFGSKSGSPKARKLDFDTMQTMRLLCSIDAIGNSE